MGKNMKLEKNHFPLCQADHWIWNMGMDVGVMRDRVFRSCSPMMPLQPGLGYRWSWESLEKESCGTWACLGMYTYSPIDPILSRFPFRSFSPSGTLTPQGQGFLWSLPDSHLLNTNTGLKRFSGALGGDPASHLLVEECSHAPHSSHSLGKPGLGTLLHLPRRKEPSMSTLERTKPKMPWGPHWIRWTLALPWKNWSGPRVLTIS